MSEFSRGGAERRLLPIYDKVIVRSDSVTLHDLSVLIVNRTDHADLTDAALLLRQTNVDDVDTSRRDRNHTTSISVVNTTRKRALKSLRDEADTPNGTASDESDREAGSRVNDAGAKKRRIAALDASSLPLTPNVPQLASDESYMERDQAFARYSDTRSLWRNDTPRNDTNNDDDGRSVEPFAESRQIDNIDSVPISTQNRISPITVVGYLTHQRDGDPLHNESCDENVRKTRVDHKDNTSARESPRREESISRSSTPNQPPVTKQLSSVARGLAVTPVNNDDHDTIEFTSADAQSVLIATKRQPTSAAAHTQHDPRRLIDEFFDSAWIRNNVTASMRESRMNEQQDHAPAFAPNNRAVAAQRITPVIPTLRADNDFISMIETNLPLYNERVSPPPPEPRQFRSRR